VPDALEEEMTLRETILRDPEAAPAAADMPHRQGLAFMQLTRRTCRWPIGDPRKTSAFAALPLCGDGRIATFISGLHMRRRKASVRGKAETGTAVREDICPYRGLAAFREEDSAFFFGRGSADDPASDIGKLVCKVREFPFVMVVGRAAANPRLSMPVSCQRCGANPREPILAAGKVRFVGEIVAACVGRSPMRPPLPIRGRRSATHRLFRFPPTLMAWPYRTVKPLAQFEPKWLE
jgi:hypothetical protein